MIKKHPNIALAAAGATLIGGIAAAHYLWPAATPLRDFNSLSAPEQQALAECTMEKFTTINPQRVVNELVERSKFDHTIRPQLDNPHTAAPLILQTTAKLAVTDCAHESGVAPETIPPFQIAVRIVPGAQPQQPALPHSQPRKFEI